MWDGREERENCSFTKGLLIFDLTCRTSESHVSMRLPVLTLELLRKFPMASSVAKILLKV